MSRVPPRAAGTRNDCHRRKAVPIRRGRDMTEDLSSWRDGPAKQAIIDFVARTCGEGGSPAVPPEDRVAVFDNDGTLWCEKPMPIQLDFILRRLAEMVRAQPELAA